MLNIIHFKKLPRRYLRKSVNNLRHLFNNMFEYSFATHFIDKIYSLYCRIAGSLMVTTRYFSINFFNTLSPENCSSAKRNFSIQLWLVISHRPESWHLRHPWQNSIFSHKVTLIRLIRTLHCASKQINSKQNIVFTWMNYSYQIERWKINSGQYIHKWFSRTFMFLVLLKNESPRFADPFSI